MHTSKIALSVLIGAGAAFAQCNPPTNTLLRTFDPWAVSFYYPSSAGNTLNQYVDVNAAVPLTINQILSTSYDQAAGSTTPPDQVGNVAEVRIYTIAGTHVGQEQAPASWTHVSTAEMTIVAWNGDCVTQNFKDPVTLAPTPLVLPAGAYGVCIEYIPTTWQGTTALPQTNVPLLNPGSLSVIGYSPVAYPDPLQSDQFLQLSNGDIQTSGWQTVDTAGVLNANTTIGGIFSDQPNLAFDYTPDPTAGTTVALGGGCYDLPFMIYEQIPGGTQPIDIVNKAYTAILTPSVNGGFYQISEGGIPYLPPPTGATNLTLGGTAAPPVAASAGLDDGTFAYTPSFPVSLPSPNGGLQATEIGINTNGKVYFDTVAPSATSFQYNGANYGSIVPFRDETTQWCVWNTDLDPSTGVGDVYVMEPSPNLGGVMIWWDGVPNWPAVGGETCSFSIEWTPDGSVVNIAYGSTLWNGSAGTTGNDAIVGFSAGNGEPVGGALDWSAIPSQPGAAVSGDGSSAPTLELSSRPVAGQTSDLVMGNLPAYPGPIPHIGLYALNISANPVPVDLSIIGAPGCPFYPSLAPSPIIVSGIEAATLPGEIRLPFPFSANTAGIDVYAQGAALHLQFPPNALGFTLTNGVCIKIGSL